ncbi:uncharacterized protein J4E92_004183 [Alternaria infectoria]|uniref:uncharacterized protein n=1 Tax=Alternaria infectoria TaxID=45303 RepID=UPI0022203248|nr:uncharacterized protein J4E92_004183 [Alternaria infectoria]KAI4932283.1 hypothetical protein J4E92_004183 [Alternaria infectoria]
MDFYAMFHPLAYLVKLNIEMSMAHLIKTIALGSPNPGNDPSRLLTFSSSPGEDMFNVNMFAEVPQQRRSLIRGLFGSDHISFSQEDVRMRKPGDSSTGSTSVPDYELPSWKPRTEKEPDMIGSDDLSSEAKNNTRTHQENCRQESKVPRRARSLDGGPSIPMPAAVHLPTRANMSEVG